MAHEHEGNMVNEFPVSGWKEYWESLINENTALRARVARLENGLKSILAVRKTAQAMEMPETWSIAATQMESIARHALAGEE